MKRQGLSFIGMCELFLGNMHSHTNHFELEEMCVTLK